MARCPVCEPPLLLLGLSARGAEACFVLDVHPAQAYSRQLEQQLGRAKAELERLQQENKALQRKAVVLSKHASFRRTTERMVQELISSSPFGQRLPSGEWSGDCSQAVLDVAERSLPAPAVIEQLRRMTVAEAIAFYNRCRGGRGEQPLLRACVLVAVCPPTTSQLAHAGALEHAVAITHSLCCFHPCSVLGQVKELLQEVDHGPDRTGARRQLDELFAVEGGTGVSASASAACRPVVLVGSLLAAVCRARSRRARRASHASLRASVRASSPSSSAAERVWLPAGGQPPCLRRADAGQAGPLQPQ